MKHIIAREVKSSDSESSEFLRINNSGAFVETENPIITSRPDGRTDFQLIYVSRGSILLTENGTEHMADSGGLILFRPHEPQLYTALAGSTYYWIHFSGTAASEMLSFFTERYYKIGAFSEFEACCKATVSAYATQKNNYQLYCAGQLVCLIALISQKLDNDDSREHEQLTAAMIDIHTNFTLQRSNDEYASMCGLSKSHFIRLFHKYIGMPPQKYRASVAMREAKHLLKSNSVSNTANILGYTDVFYFSRVFKKFMGVSPNEYKKH